MTKRLNKEFFERDTLGVARGLLGKVLVRRWRGKEIRGIICETEAYKGFADRASHAHKGKTPRTEIMFGEAGRAYVYLVYGMHHCLNVVCEREEYPAAILLRGVITPVITSVTTGTGRPPKTGTPNTEVAPPYQRIDGPGKLCHYFHIDKSFNGENIAPGDKLWIEDAPDISARKIKKTPRVGVDYAGKCKDRPWRFILLN